MKFRRSLALLTSLSMLLVSVKAGERSCAGHDRVATSGVQAHVHHAAPRAHAHASLGAAAHASETPAQTPCELPAAHCCDALNGCESAAMTTYDGVSPRPEIQARAIASARHDSPATVAAAPEPPPPKG